MLTSLSGLVDNLSEIYKKGYKSCKKRKEVISVRKFIGLKNNGLYYECKECNDGSHESMNELNKKFLNTYRFGNEDVNKFVFVIKKRF